MMVPSLLSVQVNEYAFSNEDVLSRKWMMVASPLCRSSLFLQLSLDSSTHHSFNRFCFFSAQFPPTIRTNCLCQNQSACQCRLPFCTATDPPHSPNQNLFCFFHFFHLFRFLFLSLKDKNYPFFLN
ncbi:hypothetical protein V8G54_021925 [Vigna mungo]|uniref:Uncharacterized protein n=1 Tax=Vigna mungo TaxID=3915 RepID=A0AAQ3NE96_VIGMU